ncbi:B-cell linker protein isoform X3 [Cheilinus undulatus]|uniref:B-cell linker protein isoform X3 n=1 Tax=Cheilinus undulatus TaxID=241271 RepID=UPI001BD424FF|nr:B-cell linker protein isoform X3 [Cheilinus undulatus]
MNMETLGRLAAPATAKIRQLQKIVQDIKKNDGSLLNKLRRLKNKPVPKVPERDYRADDGWDCDDLPSEPDYDNDMYLDPREDHDQSYEPPPSLRELPTTSSVSFPRGEYIDSCRNRPERPLRKLPHPGKASKPLLPEPSPVGSDEDEYVTPDTSGDENNYVEPEDNQQSNSTLHSGSRTGRERPAIPSHLSKSSSRPGVSIPEQEESSLRRPANRLCPPPSKISPSLAPKPGPRILVKSPQTVQEPTEEDEYEVCDPDNGPCEKPSESPPKILPKPVPRGSPKPPIRPRPDLKPREFTSQTMPVMHTEPKPPPKTFTLDMKRPKIPLPQVISSKAADRGSDSAEEWSPEQDKDADLWRKPWYANTCDRKTADDILIRSNRDGAFMVRKSSGQNAKQPYTLVVYYKSRVYNIPIRFILASQQYALGREKKGEEYFSSVTHIIENHQRNPLVLIDSQSNSKDATKLSYPVKP